MKSCTEMRVRPETRDGTEMRVRLETRDGSAAELASTVTVVGWHHRTYVAMHRPCDLAARSEY